MSNPLITDRQKSLLESIIKEFIETGEAVGSISILEKYNFKLSSATIRNEMAELVFRGYLYKKHTSAGRIPTNKGWKFFVNTVKADEINYIDSEFQNEMMSNLVKLKDEKTVLIRQSLNFLATLSENAAIALVGNNLYYSGLSSLINIPEMRDEENLKRILQILEDYYTLSDVFNKNVSDLDEVQILIGEEDIGHEEFKDYSIIFAGIKFKDSKGFIAVIGPNRMRYDKIISAVKYISDSIRFVVNS